MAYKIIRPIHELLTILRDKARVSSKGLTIKAGLCYEVDALRDSNIIRWDERNKLCWYIRENMPKYVIPDTSSKYSPFSSHGFGWLPTRWQPRLTWLNEQIELTTPKE